MSKTNKSLYFYLMLFSTTQGLSYFIYPILVKPITFIDALFIASSAFTVTGLSPVDIGAQFNLLGSYIIINTNRLGYCYRNNAHICVLNKKVSLQNRFLIMVTWNIDEAGGVVKLIKHLAIYSFITELIGAFCLSLSFIPKFGIGQGLFISLFTAVSAFNNLVLPYLKII